MPYAPRATLDNPYGPQVTFRTEDILPPPAYYVSPEDQIVLWALGDAPNYGINLQVRLLLPSGEVKALPYSCLSGPGNAVNPALQLAPVEGYILGMICWCGNCQRGQLFVSVQVMRGTTGQMNITGEVLLQGYTSPLSALSYPTTPTADCFSGRGAFLTITLPNQTGTSPTWVAPPATLWRVCSLDCVLTTSATAGTRQVEMILSDTVPNITGVWLATQTQAAGLTYRYSFSPGVANAFAAPSVTIAGPTDLYLPAGWTLFAYVAGLQSNDQFSQTAMMVEEWVGR